MQRAHSAASAQVVMGWKLVPGLQLVRIRSGVGVREAARQYRQDQNVLYAEPNFIVHALVSPNDPDFSQLWNLQNTGQLGGVAGADIHATQAWNLTTGSANVVVAVIDTGVDYSHPDLGQNVWTATSPFSAFDINGNPMTCPAGSRGFNALIGACDPLDDNGHGTHVSGTVGAVGNNQLGITGVNWRVQVLPCKFLGADGSGSTSGAIECLEVIKSLRDSGIDIVATNNSWGGGGFSQALEDAIAAHLSDGILFVAAAGNDFSDNDVLPVYPADYNLPNIVAVAATTRTDSTATFSNLGRHTVHLGAPGVDILSTTPNNTYSILSGTSMATPHVTGVAALLAAQDSSRDWRAIKNLLLAGGDNNAALSKTITGKRLNAYGSLTCANSAVYSRLQPALSVISGAVGQSIPLTALNINCANPAGTVQVTVSPGNQTISLLDDGNGSDLAAGDGVYSGSWTPTALGDYALAFPGGDVIQVSVLQNYGPIAQTSSNYQTFTGTNLNLGDDDVSVVASPFPIAFGGGSFSQLFVSSNGTLSFTNAYGEYANDALPLESGVFRPEDVAVLTLVAPFWDDLYPIQGTSQNVFWGVTGTAPNRELIVEWRDVRSFECRNDPSATVKFQVVFEENSGNVFFNYADTVLGGNCSFEDGGGSATVGIQVAPGLGSLWSYDQQVIGDGSSLLWQTPPPTPGNNPLPTLSSLSPNAAVLGGPSFTLTLTGTNFVPDSYIVFAGNARAATYVGSTQLQAQISAADINLYDGPGQIQVAVANPSPGGGTSNALSFTFQAAGPTIASLSPASALAGGFGFVLTVSGSNFAPAAQVQWNGQSRQTFVQNPNLVTALINDSDIAAAGTAKITVVNPSPGGGVSNSINFSIAARGALGANLMIQPGARPWPGMQHAPANKPIRFLGWNLASRLGPDYLRRFNRPRADIALPISNSPALAESTGAAGNSGSALPLPGFGFRDSLPADFIPSGIAAGDFNHDGHADWVVANGGSNTLWVYLGKGDGTSQLPIIYPLTGQAPVAVVAADLRGHGILDLIVAEADSGTVGVLLGNGDGTFQRETEYFVPGPPLTLAVADLNKDGHLDVVVGTIASAQVNGFITMFGDGTGSLGTPISAPVDDINNAPFVTQMSLADFNNDGLPDIVYVDPNNDSEAWTFVNQGDGTFKRSQLLIYGFPLGGVFVVGTATGDLNSDGCADIAVLFNGMTFVYDGDCSGVFKTLNFVTYGLGDTPFAGAIADVNGDGKPDLITTGVFVELDAQYGRPAGDLVTVQLNDGNGGLLAPKVYRGDTSMYSFALADVNGDGKPDLISANEDSDSATVFLNDGKGGFGSPQGGYVGYLTRGGNGAINAPWSDFLVADLNGDGYPDLGVIELPRLDGSPWQLATMLNDGTGHFGPPQSIDILDFNNLPGDFVFADFRKTGKPDFLELGSFFSNGAPALIYAKNNGDGTFAYPTVTAASAAQGIVATGDFNRDGNLDFAVAGVQGAAFTVTPFLGRGDGTFTQGSTISSSIPPNSGGFPSLIFAGDFNRDGKMDLLVWISGNTAGVQHPLYEFLGNGDGTFRTPTLLFPDFQPFAVADLNKDGLPDIVELNEPLAVWGTAVPSVYQIYLGQPDGSFALTNTYQPYNGSFDPSFLVGASPTKRLSPMIADFNGDGNLDIAVFQNPETSRNFPEVYFQVLLGNGDGTFTPSYTVFPLKKPDVPSTAADLNGDGRADLIELDSLTSSFHVIPAVPGPSFQVRLVSDPVVGGAGILQITLALVSAGSTTLQLSASDAAISMPSSVTVPAGNAAQDVPFKIGSAFNMNRVFAIQAQSGSEIHTAYGTMANPSLPIGFAISAGAPASPVTVAGGTLQGYSLSETSLAGYAALLTPTCVGLPAGSHCQFSVTPIDLPAGGQSYEYFSIGMPDSIAVGNYSFQLQVTDGTLTQTASLSFQIGDFALSLSPTGMSTLPTADVNFLVNSSAVNNFSGAVNLTCSTPLASISCQVNGSPLYTPGQAVVTVQTQNTPIGTYALTVTGTTGSVSRTVTEQLVVGNVTSSIAPTSATIAVGAQGTFTLSLSSQGGFADVLTYSCTNDVGAVACQFNPASTTLLANGSTTTTLTLRVEGKPSGAIRGTPARRSRSSVNPIDLPVTLLAGLLLGFRITKRDRWRQRNFRLAVAWFALAVAVSPWLVSCGGGGTQGQPPPPPPPTIINVVVQATSGSLTLNAGTITVSVP